MTKEEICNLWHWLTTTRYTRLLEEEVVRLRVENVALRNSIYARAGVPPVEYAAALAPAFSPAGRGAGAPAPVRRPLSWAQAKARLESLHRVTPGKTEEKRDPSLRQG
ncbi:MAG: hypothetical protein GZ088_13250 [Acidipila sp.]|nr:hypothetical protein [Acidipila sp.]